MSEKECRAQSDAVAAFLKEYGSDLADRSSVSCPPTSTFDKIKRTAFRTAPWNFFKTAGRKILFGGIHRACRIPKKQRAAEESAHFERRITFSLLVPLYNTPLPFLEEMIASVQAQTYPHWELCLADGSDDTHGDVGAFCRALAERDSRIRYTKLEKNRGISENTNACIEMATGEYISLFDHDDLLHPSALFETVRAVFEHHADLIYTDEATFTKHGPLTLLAYHYKPDFAPDNLRANNYICHFTSFSRTLLEKAGTFRREYDGSQDHDMVLRLSEQASHIFHIRKALYFWRSHSASVASDLSSKPYVLDAGMHAVRDSVKRVSGQEVTVERATAASAHYRVRYPIEGEPLVSVLLGDALHQSALARCVASILSKTTYRNYEILISAAATLDTDFREKLTAVRNIRVVDGDLTTSADGRYLLFLSAQSEVITPDWIEELLMYSQRTDVGAVGAKLLYPDNTVSDASLLLGVGKNRTVASAHHGFPANDNGYAGRLCYAQNVTAVSSACMMLSREHYKSVSGIASAFGSIYNDVELCLQLREKGLLIIFNPHAVLYRHIPKRRPALAEEAARFKANRADAIKKGDPYYNPNFSAAYADFRLK